MWEHADHSAEVSEDSMARLGSITGNLRELAQGRG